MFTNQSTDLSLDEPCRAVAAIRGDTVEHRWVVGTGHDNNSNNNQHLHVLRFHADVNELTVERSFGLLDEDVASVACVASSPTDRARILTAQGSAATLWRLPAFSEEEDTADDDANTNSSSRMDTSQHSHQQLQSLTSLLPEGGFGANLVDLAWHDGGRHDHDTTNTAGGAADVLLLDQNGHLTQWDLAAETSVRAVDTADAATGNVYYVPPRVAWDPHGNGDAVAVTHGGTHVRLLDWRIGDSNGNNNSATTVELPHCHRGGVTSLDYNPNKPYTLATAGQDGVAKVWDLRYHSGSHHHHHHHQQQPYSSTIPPPRRRRPVLTARGGHSHWIASLHYNPCHDQLVLTTGTEGVANLWRWSTVSSAPLMLTTDHSHDNHHHHNHNNNHTNEPENGLVRRHEHGGESCCASAWGAADAWIYLTVSLDSGKVVLSHVPSREKYKILL